MRCFLGLSLPDQTCQALTALQGGLPGARWLAPHNLHLTLLFMGDLTDEALEEFDWGLQDLSVPAFSVSLQGLGCFERKGGATTSLWVGVAPEPRLGSLAAELRALADRLAIPFDRQRFRPHVTLARFRARPVAEVMGWIEGQGAPVLPSFAVAEFHLYSSRLRESGADYRIEASYPLLG